MSQTFMGMNPTMIFKLLNWLSPVDKPEILAWLSPPEPWVRHRDIVSQRVQSVGSWLLETEEFRHWYKGGSGDESNNATLFCDGSPGAGKSCITSLVIDKLCDEAAEGNTAVTFFYFDFAARNEQSPVIMLSSLLRQLVSGLDEIPEVVVNSFRNEKEFNGGGGPQVSRILKMFQTITATKRTFICVDAIDECVPEHRMVVLESLGQILQRSPNTRLFMTGRSHVRGEVQRELNRAATFISIQPMEGGLVTYLCEKLRKDTARSAMNTTLEAEIVKSIPEISSETFLLASLHIDAILRETTIAHRRKRLELVKEGVGLGDAYGVTLERIKVQDEEKAKLAIATLTWICHSERQLEVDELCHALAVEIGTTDFDPENVPSIDILLNYCQGLVTLDNEASTVRLIHFTVQEYLCSHPDLFSKPHAILSETCLTYLNSSQVQNLPARTLPDHQTAPFLKYSSQYWGTHANKDLSDNATTLALQLFDQYEDHASAVSLLQQAIRPGYIRDISTPLLFSGLHCASFFGIVELVTALINVKGCKTNPPDCGGRAPLSWAARNGYEGVVEALLEQEDVEPGHQDVDGLTPLGLAAREGSERVVKLLLSREDVDPNRPDNRNRTPLGWAARNGHGGVAKLLLHREDVDPNLPDNSNLTPLDLAVGHGHEGMVKLLLGRKDVDPDHPDVNGLTPLMRAAIHGYEGVVGLLLDRDDVDPNHRGGDDRTPLWHAACGGHQGVIRLLLDRKDVHPHHADTYGVTPLGSASGSGHEGAVKLLLDQKDVDPNHPDMHGQTPLALANMWRHEGVVKLLQARQSSGNPDA